MDLQIKMAVEGKLDQYMAQRQRGIASAVTRAVRGVTAGLRKEIARQAKKADFKSDGLENLIKAKYNPIRGYLPDAEGVVYSVARVKRGREEVDLFDVFDHGAVIQAKGGKWLAIPAEGAVGKRANPFGGMTKYRPGQLQDLQARADAFDAGRDTSKIMSRRLRKTAGGRASLVMANLRGMGKGGLKFIPTKKPGLAMLAYVDPRTGSMSVAYWLVRKVVLRKRLDLKRAEQKWLPRLETRINRNLDRFVYRTGIEV